MVITKNNQSLNKTKSNGVLHHEKSGEGIFHLKTHVRKYPKNQQEYPYPAGLISNAVTVTEQCQLQTCVCTEKCRAEHTPRPG